MKDKQVKESITILLPAGRLPLDLMNEVHQLAQKYTLGVYLSTMQNLRLTNVPPDKVDIIKSSLKRFGGDLKGAGKFPLPRVCTGEDSCKLGVISPEDLSRKILDRFALREHTKAKFKIAISGCQLCCAGVKTTDIGIMATREGYDVFVGGKGGAYPKIGMRVATEVDEMRILEIVETIVEFHDQNTKQKQRIYKLIDHERFPFKEV